MNLQPKVSTSAALFVGDIHDVSKLKGKDWVITLRVFEGGATFYFSDESGEAKLIFKEPEGVREIRREDFAGSLTGSKLRVSAADPVAGPWRRTGQSRTADPKVTYQCSIHVRTERKE
jgi:hypothetical protein